MRNYQAAAHSGDKGLKRRKALYAVLFGITMAVIALIVTLSVTLGTKNRAGEVEAPVGTTESKFVLPMNDFTLGKGVVLDKLIYHSSLNQWRTHNGMDFLANEGTGVFAVMDGKVLSAQNTQLDGGVVMIEHKNGLVSIYKGLGADITAEAGHNVKSGDKIGTVGAILPRERSEGAHLHLEMKLNDNFVNPLNYLPDVGEK
jgi:murein DD-endopeptidase MepM/ murein hydrolase activator NlpD